MKKIAKFIIILSFIFLNISNVLAATCDPSDPTYNPTDFSSATASAPEAHIIYDITSIDIDKDSEKLSITGWAFNKGFNATGPNDIKVYFALFPTSGEKVLIENTTYFTAEYLSKTSDYGTGYKELTYWVCNRNSDNKCNAKFTGSLDSDGDPIPKNSGSGTKSLKGGFRAILDLKKFKEYITAEDKPTEYILYMAVDSLKSTVKSGPPSVSKIITDDSLILEEEKWFKVGIYDGADVVKPNVRDYNDTSDTEISISGFSKKARVVATSSRLLSETGMYCNSAAANSGLTGSKSYFVYGETYDIVDVKDAYKGPSNAPYHVTTYGLKTTSTSAPCSNVYGKKSCTASGGKQFAKGTDWTAYASAAWVNITGEIKIKFTKPDEPELIYCPEGTIGSTDDGLPFWEFDLNVFHATDDGENVSVCSDCETYTGSRLTVLKSLIEEKLGHEIEEGNIAPYIVADENMYIVVDDMDRDFAADFYNTYLTAYNSNGEMRYYTESADTGLYYYFAPTADSPTAVFNPNSVNLEQFMAKIAPFVGYGGDLLENKFSDAENRPYEYVPGITYAAFCIKECEGDDCEPEPPTCEDTTTNSNCTSTGTKAVFHEDNNLETCTLEKGTSSGFTIVESSETRGYCEVACKEDYDIELPGTKYTTAGRYFKLDNYIPQITAKRTCATTKISYDTFDEDLSNIEPNIAKNYNNWQDYYDISNGLTGNPGNGSSTCEHCYSCDCDDDGCSTCCDTYSYNYQDWEIYPYSALNYTDNDYPGSSGHWESSTPCSGGGTTFETALSSAKTHYRNLAASSKSSYNSNLDTYIDTINKYNACYNWTDKTRNVRKDGDISDISSSLNIDLADAYQRDDYRYSFNPTVTFTYADRERAVFGGTYSYVFEEGDIEEATSYINGATETAIDYNSTDATPSLQVFTDYWDKSGSASGNYSEGATSTQPGEFTNPDAPYKVTRNVIKCTNHTCSYADIVSTIDGRTSEKSSDMIETYFYQSAYLKQTETLSYKYHLPRISTSIPNGIVNMLGTYMNFEEDSLDTNHILLEKEAVPVSINTFAGKYPYYIKITNLKDTLRVSKTTNNPDDNLEDRFKESGVLFNNETDDNSTYVCYYDVVNDTYVPCDGDTCDRVGFNFFYRVIDMSNINPIGRTLGYNWTTSKANEVIGRMESADRDYQVLINSDNDESRVKFEFVLTPVKMRSIRNYNMDKSNAGNGYSDWTLTCNDYPAGDDDDSNGYHCTSEFLSCLAEGGTPEANGDDVLCTDVTGENGDYDAEDLRVNRQNLINIMNDLDRDVIGSRTGG